ncbi:hypothetical protein [Streptomyces sp. NPDC057623]|uniref:hypothetical protein n=1 Tax=Streptomyces sp. NPDC057623 TaxID=3346187 RepID=UPI0036980CA8
MVLQRGMLRVVSAGARRGASRRTSSGVGTGGVGGVTGVSCAASRSPGSNESLQRGRGVGSDTLWVMAFTRAVGVLVVAVAY